MKSNKLHRLAIAIAAAGLLAGGITKAISTEMSATTFVTSLHQYIENGDLAAAQAALQQLRALGIKHVKLGNQLYLVDDLIAWLSDPAQARALLAQLDIWMNSGVVAEFVAEDRVVVSSVKWDNSTDLFPTGSTTAG